MGQTRTQADPDDNPSLSNGGKGYNVRQRMQDEKGTQEGGDCEEEEQCKKQL